MKTFVKTLKIHTELYCLYYILYIKKQWVESVGIFSCLDIHILLIFTTVALWVTVVRKRRKVSHTLSVTFHCYKLNNWRQISDQLMAIRGQLCPS